MVMISRSQLCEFILIIPRRFWVRSSVRLRCFLPFGAKPFISYLFAQNGYEKMDPSSILGRWAARFVSRASAKLDLPLNLAPPSWLFTYSIFWYKDFSSWSCMITSLSHSKQPINASSGQIRVNTRHIVRVYKDRAKKWSYTFWGSGW